MREYGKVYTAFWTSVDARAMSEDGRTLALYLLTCPHGNMLGCFRLSDAYAADDLQWTQERVRKGFAELLEKGFAYRCERSFLVFIREYLKWNRYENPNVVRAAEKMFVTLSGSDIAKSLLVKALREHEPRFKSEILADFERSTEPFEDPFETISKTRARARAGTIATTGAGAGDNNTVDRRKTPAVSDPDPVPQIFAYWQKTMASPTSRLDAKRVSKIRAAMKMGYTPRELCEAIKGCSLTPHNMGQNERNTKYNTIELILRDADHIDTFIRNAKTPPTAGGQESIEQRNARILAEVTGQQMPVNDDDIIDMENEDEQQANA